MYYGALPVSRGQGETRHVANEYLDEARRILLLRRLNIRPSMPAPARRATVFGSGMAVVP